MATEVQLKDAQGNDITPKGGGGSAPTSMQASQVTLASGTGLNSTNVQNAMKELNDKIEEGGGGGSGESASYDVAIGTKGESCLVDDVTVSYVGYTTLPGRMPLQEKNTNVVAMSLDDMARSDYVGTRKINNKYNFRTTFNWIIAAPKTSDQAERVYNIKRLAADGNELGFHAPFATSFFWRNLMFDARPDSTTSFSPTLDELRTSVSGSKNIFGQTITSNSTFSTVGLKVNTNVSNVKLSEATQEDWYKAVTGLSVYGTNYATYGLDLTGALVAKGVLGWLEYWYNELIDNTLGYSTTTTEGTNAERFAADYSGTYPDAAHILSGELDGYGVFTKGLFKGCHSCCNFEVVDRILSIMEAYVRHYYGINGFTNMAYHGGTSWAGLWWKGQDGFDYCDRDCSVISTGHTPLYMSLFGCKLSLFDILLKHGIRMNKRNIPTTGVQGELGLIRGQKRIRGPYFNTCDYIYQQNITIGLLGVTPNRDDGYSVSYEDFVRVMPKDFEQWHKFAYENAGVELEPGIFMKDTYKTAIDTIKRSMGTGKIPALGCDEIYELPTLMGATELIYHYCYKHNLRICTFNEAMNIANEDRNTSGNLFPNPSFYQSLLDDFGGSSTSLDAYIPDSFDKLNNCTIGVTNSDGNKVLNLSEGNHATSGIYTRIFGLPSGKYRISMMAKATGNGNVKIYKKLNGDKLSADPTLVQTLSCQSDFSEISYDLVIPEHHKNASDGTYANTVCNGYEDNIAFIQISFDIGTSGTLSIYNPRIDKV